MDRNDFKHLAALRLKEAEVLLSTRNYSGAYYLSGYVVECAFKACIARNTKRHQFPDKKLANESYTHDLESLSKVASLGPVIAARMGSDSIFTAHWRTAKGWTEESRYQVWTRQQARDLYRAITDKEHGVLPWIQQYW